jgi:bacterioferritin-associated ferredoxin
MKEFFCSCRDVSTTTVTELLSQGKTPQQIRELTTLGSGCMWCMEKLETIYNQSTKILL